MIGVGDIMVYEGFMNCDNVYFSDNWIEYNKCLWGVEAERIKYISKNESFYIECVLYLNKSGKVVLPPGNSFLPLRFVHTNTTKKCQIYSQYVDVVKVMADDLKHRGVEGGVVFSPGMIDGRPLSWTGYRLGIKYTFIAKFPLNEVEFDTSIRKNIKKAISKGYTVKELYNESEIVKCIKATASSKNFDLYLGERELKLFFNIVDSSMISSYAAYTANGQIAAVQVKLVSYDGMCIDWLAGAYREFLSDGVTQLLYYETLKDCQQRGARYFDFCGANIESVALAKSQWGFEIVPYLYIPEADFKIKLRSLVKKALPVHDMRTCLRRLRYRF